MLVDDIHVPGQFVQQFFLQCPVEPLQMSVIVRPSDPGMPVGLIVLLESSHAAGKPGDIEWNRYQFEVGQEVRFLVWHNLTDFDRLKDGNHKFLPHKVAKFSKGKVIAIWADNSPIGASFFIDDRGKYWRWIPALSAYPDSMSSFYRITVRGDDGETYHGDVDIKSSSQQEVLVVIEGDSKECPRWSPEDARRYFDPDFTPSSLAVMLAGSD